MIAVGCDHAGYFLKTEITRHLEEKGYPIKDFGVFENNKGDYADYGLLVGEAVISGECEKGIIVCGTGIGISISANKIPGVRAALCTDSFMAKMSREHNDANVLALGARVIGTGLALEIVDAWLGTEFAGGRHKDRVEKITQIEKKYLKNI